MSFVAVAIAGSAVVGAGATLYASGKAAKAQSNSANQASALEQKQLDEQTREYNQGREDLAPWRAAGTTALGQLTKLTSGDPAAVKEQLTADPGYQFGMDQGVRARDASASARGGILSGGALKAITRYGTDYAGTKLNESFNRLSAIAGLGQTAENQQLGSTANYLNQQQQGVGNISNNILGAGNARASQYVAGGNAISGAANQVSQYYALKDLMPQGGAGGGGGFNFPNGFFKGAPVQGYVGNDDYTYG